MMSMLEVVRSFHRVVTQRAGALDDRYLARGRSLAQSRLLWEIGSRGGEVRGLRARLGLDSGYLSRLLQRLEADGLIDVQADRQDRRVRVAVLTPAGRAECDELDRLSDELARSILQPLTDRQRDQLVAAMGTVDRLLRAGLVQIEPADPEEPDVRSCLTAYVAELDRRFDGGFDPAHSLPADPECLSAPRGLLLCARLQGEAIGCGAVTFHGHGPAEIKRMWVAPHARGMGVARRILGRLEDAARRHGACATRLETNRALSEAVELYRASGYEEVPAFSGERYAHHWFEKRLPTP